MRRVFWLVFAITASLAAAQALAQAQSSDRIWRICNTAGHDQRIAACSAIIQFGRDDANEVTRAYYNRAVAQHASLNLRAAIVDYDEAVRRAPGEANFLLGRGQAWHDAGNDANALADFDRAIRLNPTHEMAYVRRGVVRFSLGRYAEAAADFEESLRTHPSDGYRVLWRHISLAKAGRADPLEFQANAAKPDPNTWPAPLLRFYQGRATIDEIRQQAGRGNERAQSAQRCEASFYLGVYEQLQNNLPHARGYLQDAVNNCPKNFSEFAGAMAELHKLPPAPPQPTRR
jgi:lipoprotein NlpI